MSRTSVWAVLFVALAVGLVFPASNRKSPELAFEPRPEPPPGARMAGVGWVAGEAIEGPELDAVREAGADWIAQTPFGWQESPREPGLRLITEGRVYWGETDEGLEKTTRLARERGLATLLKPHVWLGEGWRGELEMTSDEDWDRWLAEYEAFVLHYARLAERLEIEGFVVGTELHRAVLARPDDWRRIIETVRKVYSGHLTYAANWAGEVEDVPFWDLLDSVGVQAYYPLTEEETPSLGTLREGWEDPRRKLETIHRRTGKPILFTEIGYRAMSDAAIEPWQWPERSQRRAETADLRTQARCYEAFFREIWTEPWLVGAFFWKWYPEHDRAGGPDHPGFTPQNKPAAKVLAAWYRAADSYNVTSRSPMTLPGTTVDSTERKNAEDALHLNEITHTSGLETVAASVEEEPTPEPLRTLGVDPTPGYLIDRPRLPDEPAAPKASSG